ncbi:MAG: hypothetical protein GX868_01415 [Actinobacteria bacterium]|nr:hypothetical protein [Actinomycetota bacterium]
MGSWVRLILAAVTVAVPFIWFVDARRQRRAIEPRRLLTHRTTEQVVAAAHAAIRVRGWTLIDDHNPVVFRSPLWRGRTQEIAVLSQRSRSGTIVVAAPLRYFRNSTGFVPSLSRSTNRRLKRFEELLHAMGAPPARALPRHVGAGGSRNTPVVAPPLRSVHGRVAKPDGPAPRIVGHEYAAKPIAIRNAVLDVIDATQGWTLVAVDDWVLQIEVRSRVLCRDRVPAMSVTIAVGEGEGCGACALTGAPLQRRVREDQERLALCAIERRLRTGLRDAGIWPAPGVAGCAFPGLVRAANELDDELRGGPHR